MLLNINNLANINVAPLFSIYPRVSLGCVTCNRLESRMRVIISGPVKPEHIDLADIMAGITPTSLVTNGRQAPDAALGLPVVCHPVDQRLGMLGEAARDYTLCQNADALIVAGDNDHLVAIAHQYRLPVFEV